MLNREKQFTNRNGEFYAAAGETYYGGSPLGINTSGELILCLSGAADKYVGIAANNNTDDGVTASVKNKATFYFGPGIFTLQVEEDGTSYPFDSTKTFNEGDQLYIDANGKWTNVAQGSQSSYGNVMGVGTNTITIQLTN